MNTSKLKKNQVFKNYVELCNFLGIKNTGGKFKILQLKELERFCEYHKEGYKFVIDKVYTKEKEKVDKRKYGNNNKKAKCTRYLLLDFLSNYDLSKSETISFSKGNLLKCLNIINDNYVVIKNDKREYAKALGISVEAVNECLSYFDDRVMKLINRSLNTLIRESILGFKQSYTWIDEKGKFHPCSVMDHNMIMNAEYDVLQNEFNGRSKYFISQSDIYYEFKMKVKSKLKEKHPVYFGNLSKYYNSFNFHFNTNDLLDYKKYMEDKNKLNKQQCLIDLQELWKENVEGAINARIENAKKIKYIKDIHRYRLSDKYVEEQMLIVKSLTDYTFKTINIEHEQLVIGIDDLEIPF